MNKCVFTIVNEVSERIKRISEKTHLTKGEILEKLIVEQSLDERIIIHNRPSEKDSVTVNWYISDIAFDKLKKLAAVNGASQSAICQMLVNSLIDAKIEIVIEYDETY